MDDRYNDKNVKAASGTCEWLLPHETYKSWAASSRGLLWIKGKPGSGKSTLLRYALENVKKSPGIGDGSIVLSFFFHSRGVKLQKTPLGLFRSLLHQVLSQVPDVLPGLVDTFQKYCMNKGESGKDWQWDSNELQHFFELSLSKVLENRPVRLFVDALDECGEEDAVDLAENFNSLLQSLPSTTAGQLHICFSCRDYLNLELNSGGRVICVGQENGPDISTYVQAKLSGLRVRMGSTLPDLITGRADGVFMWARLVVERVLKLEREGEGPRRIEDAVYAIPTDLHKLYDELVRSVDKNSASIKLIQWICFAKRPLSLDELRWAMIVDADCSYKSLRQCENAEDYAWDCDMMERRLKMLSRGLAETVPSSNTRVVQFIHQSVQDFFVKEGLLILYGSLKSAETEVGIAHYQLSRICIRYLAMEEIARSTGRHDGLTSEFPLLYYATTSWVWHVQQSEMRRVSQDDLLDYFAWPSEALMQLWVEIYSIISPSLNDCPPKGTKMVHIASRYQLMGPLRVILRRADQGGTDIDAKNLRGWTPLLWAAANGCKAVVQLLLATNKVDAGAEDYLRCTPLFWAATNGHRGIVQLLLATGKVDANAKNNSRGTPLLSAAANGHEAVVQLLLASGKVDAEAKDDSGRTSLLSAAANGHEAVVQLLLATGKVDADAKDNWSRTPLLWAAANGRKGVVQLLLATDKVDAEAKDKWGRTPLLWAAANGRRGVVQLLLATDKVNPDAKDTSSWTSLSWAAKNGHGAVVQLLLATGKVNADMKSNLSRTPLLLAAANGHEAVVQLLLATGKVDADAKDNSGRTPLLSAAANGHEAVVQLLLATGKVADAKDSLGGTPLSWTAENGRGEQQGKGKECEGEQC
ncbi:hypothetical protein AUP68_16923 [Ilyonectria robusta]